MKYVQLATLLILVLATGCKKNNLSLLGSNPTVTHTGTNLILVAPNIFTPNGDNVNDYFFGPIYQAPTSGDSVIHSSLTIYNYKSNLVASGMWDGSGQDEGVYSYKASYTTANGGSATVSGLVRLRRNSSVPCAEKSLYLFPQAFNRDLTYDTSSPFNENLPCN